MARSKEEAQQELNRLQTMLRAMPNQKDDAANDIAKKVKKLEAEIAGAGSGKSGGGGAMGVIIMVLVAILLGGVAFAAAYFGGSMMQG
jgi:hypothetical protein